MIIELSRTPSPPPFPHLDFIPAKHRIKEIIRHLFAAVFSAKKEDKASQERRFSQIIQDYGSIISGISFSYSNNPEDMKDLRQDIMINIWKGLKNFRGDSSLSTWIYRVALNTCVSTIRTKSRKVQVISLETNMDIADEEDRSRQEKTEWLHSKIASLSPLDKAIITMWLDDRKYEEIAEVTGISRNNVAVRINRIKEKLSKL
ncbi:MAG: sigma-70 family RNA polymerase sigma factor [Muribaculaceae bacterium]|nr:sigma-70 family RNA polymerase sigma factor [Muribaculaceae bacterium]